jgi:BMFP domain-containing protein YqiC
MANTPLDNLVNNLLNALPQSASELRQDMEKNFRATLQAGLEKMNLVSRSEFEAQRAVLENTRQKLEDLQQKMTELEKQLADK